MKKYNLEVNGQEFEVLIKSEEEVDSATTSSSNSKANTSINKTSNKESKNKDNSSFDNFDKETLKEVTAPMTGNILSIKINVGDQVQEDEVIFTLEAMKMETEISSPVSGKIRKITVQEGENCESGATLALIEEVV